jgi:hypothetical protein
MTEKTSKPPSIDGRLIVVAFRWFLVLVMTYIAGSCIESFVFMMGDQHRGAISTEISLGEEFEMQSEVSTQPSEFYRDWVIWIPGLSPSIDDKNAPETQAYKLLFLNYTFDGPPKDELYKFGRGILQVLITWSIVFRYLTLIVEPLLYSLRKRKADIVETQGFKLLNSVFSIMVKKPLIAIVSMFLNRLRAVCLLGKYIFSNQEKKEEIKGLWTERKRQAAIEAAAAAKIFDLREAEKNNWEKIQNIPPMTCVFFLTVCVTEFFFLLNASLSIADVGQWLTFLFLLACFDFMFFFVSPLSQVSLLCCKLIAKRTWTAVKALNDGGGESDAQKEVLEKHIRDMALKTSQWSGQFLFFTLLDIALLGCSLHFLGNVGNDPRLQFLLVSIVFTTFFALTIANLYSKKENYRDTIKFIMMVSLNDSPRIRPPYFPPRVPTRVRPPYYPPRAP